MKIDTTKIPNFDALPDDAKNAILGMEFADAPDMSEYVAKSVFDKKASEASELSKQLKAQMTEEQRTAAENEAKWAEMEAKLAKLEQEKLESTYKASYLALGYDDALATDAAKAMVAGDMTRVFANQKKNAEAAAKKLEAELTRRNPHPGGAGGGDVGQKSKAVEMAERIGQVRADSAANANSLLSAYTR